MMQRPCAGTNRDGGPCSAPALPGKAFCAFHDPEMKERIAAGRVRGGQGKSNSARARKAIPSDLRDVSDVLLAAIRDVQAGTITPGQAAALSGLARAYVAVYEAGLVEAKIEQIRALISERPAS